MPKQDPNAYQRPARKSVGRILTDPKVPGLVLDLSSCRTLGPLEVAACMTDANQVYADHFTGYGTPGEKGYVSPEYLIQGGEVVIFDLNAAQIACVLFRAQKVKDDERYTPQELLQFMVFDGLLDGMTELAAEATIQEEEAQKPDPLAPNTSGSASSPTPDTAISDLTQNSSSGGTTSSGAPTSA